MPNDTQVPLPGKTREFLAITFSVVSLLGVVGLGVATIYANEDQAESAKNVLSTLLPMIGTWVGTVLAFYFSKENFEAAARKVQDIAGQVGQEKLKSVPVQSKMIALDKMFFKTDPIDQQKLLDVLRELVNAKRGDRIPVLTSTNAVKYIIHRSLIDRYLAEKTAAPGAALDTLTFDNMFDEKPDQKQLFERSFATIKPDASLADAKAAMESVKDCEDVFVTSQGGRQDAVLGWITDNIIQENLRA